MGQHYKFTSTAKRAQIGIVTLYAGGAAAHATYSGENVQMRSCNPLLR